MIEILTSENDSNKRENSFQAYFLSWHLKCHHLKIYKKNIDKVFSPQNFNISKRSLEVIILTKCEYNKRSDIFFKTYIINISKK